MNGWEAVDAELVEAPFHVRPRADDSSLEVASDSYAVFMHFTPGVSALMAAALTDQAVAVCEVNWVYEQELARRFSAGGAGGLGRS